LGIDGGTYAYNVNAAFTSPATLNAGDRFWAGVVLPTTAAAGDTIAMITSTDGDFADPSSHSGVINAGAFLSSFDAGGISIANAIYPYVIWTSITGMGEENIEMTLFPNPTNGAMTMKFSNNDAAMVNVTDITGRKVGSLPVNYTKQIDADFSDLSNGVYILEVINSDNKVIAKSKFSKE